MDENIASIAGWKIKEGKYITGCLSEDKIWQMINYFFSDNSKKRNTYKFGLMKSIIDSIFISIYNDIEKGYYISYDELFDRFTHNYWNLVAKYGLRQMRSDGKSDISMIEKIILEYKEKMIKNIDISFESIAVKDKKTIISNVKKECKKYVLGALYKDFDGFIYSFNLKGQGIYINPAFYDFFVKYKMEVEKINYYEWAKFLEKVNNDDVLIRVIDKLDLATPRRSDLSVYRMILEQEFEQCTCFYCGKKLTNIVHVDHFIPWSFVKSDMIWNFVLSCSSCNIRKTNRIPSAEYLRMLTERNDHMINFCTNNPIIVEHFENYNEQNLHRMWKYAQISGFKLLA